MIALIALIERLLCALDCGVFGIEGSVRVEGTVVRSFVRSSQSFVRLGRSRRDADGDVRGGGTELELEDASSEARRRATGTRDETVDASGGAEIER